jgi:excisionase family DNA binding protein
MAAHVQEPYGSTRTAPLLTVNEAAAHLRCSRRLIYDLLKRGDLRPVRVGERIRFTLAELERYVARGADP